ncbi:MAG TPA: hypothetical protein VG944_16590, partial [Fimbriimonas sp.]|nr:hypothetical protein [Fimbriimonas sp.]
MTLCLVLLCLATGAYLAYFASPGARKPGTFPLGKLITAGYLLLSFLALAGMLVSYLAFPGESAERAVRHIEYRGVAMELPSLTGDASNIRLAGDTINASSDVKRAFKWYALRSGARLDLRITEIQDGKIEAVKARAVAPGQVVRIDGTCVNEAIGGWIADGKSATFEVDETDDDGKARTIRFTVQSDGNRIRVDNAGWFSLRDYITLRDALNAGHNVELGHRLLGF